MKLKLELWKARFIVWRERRKLRRLLNENAELRKSLGMPARDNSDLPAKFRENL